MATAQSTTYLDHKMIGRHVCGADWGWCGEHYAIRASYLCECGGIVHVEQCAAWPITERALRAPHRLRNAAACDHG